MKSTIRLTILGFSILLIPLAFNLLVAQGKANSKSSISGISKNLTSGNSVFLPFGCSAKMYVTFPDAFGYGFGDFAEIWQVSPGSNMMYHGSLRGANYNMIEFDLGYLSAGTQLAFKIKLFDCKSEGDCQPMGEYFQEPAKSPTFKSPSTSFSYNYHRSSWFVPDSIIGTLGFTFNPDSSTALDLRSPNGPPQQMTPFMMPQAGQVTLDLDRWFYQTFDTIVIKTAYDSLCIDPSFMQAYGWDAPVNLGNFNTGDTINVSLISAVPPLQNSICFPKIVTTPSTSWFARLDFEDWIDADFLDINGYAHMGAPAYNFLFEKDTVAPGDTIKFSIQSIGAPTNRQLDIGVLVGRKEAVLANKSGIVYGTEIIYMNLTQAQGGLCLVVSPTAKPGRIIVQVFDSWDHKYSARSELIVEGDKNEILLGETKYYQAWLDPKNENKLAIKELKQTSERSGAVLSGVSFTIEKESQDKIGVYWERKDAQGDDLEPDLIRFVGRYWEKDKIYTVKLTANYNGQTISKTVEVKKPAKLGDTHNTANNFKGVSYNLDDLIFEYAGKEGVLPQYLKAMVSKETMGFFDPCYRYELWHDIAVLQVKNRVGQREYETNAAYSHYRILSANDKGTPDIPTDHSNVRDASNTRQPYPGYITIWDYYWNHVSFYSLAIYPTGEKEDQWEIFNDEIREELYGNKTDDELSAAEKQILSDSTDARFFRWAKSEYDGGMENMIAQTRLYASYGLLQLVYKGGTEYPQNNTSYRPEDINDHTIGFKYGVQHLIGKFNLKNVLNGHFTDSTWQAGLEKKYKQTVGLYNGAGDSYANDVISRVQNFLPKP